MSSTLTNLTAATTWSGTDLFYALVGGNSRKIAASSFWVCESANVLSDVNSTTAQTVRIYRTFTDSSNYERLALSSSSGAFNITAETAGTGTDNLDLQLTPAGSGNATFNIGAGIFTVINTSAFTNLSVSVEASYLRTTGTATNDFGCKNAYYLENAAGTDIEAYRSELNWDDATNGSEDSRLTWSLMRAGVARNVFNLDSTTTATQTVLRIYSVDHAGLVRIVLGATDSGGAGFRMLRVAN